VVDPLGVFTLILTTMIVSGAFIGYYLFEDFIGIAFGIAAATATAYILRSWWLGVASKLVTAL
jgi:hypothetical protein